MTRELEEMQNRVDSEMNNQIACRKGDIYPSFLLDKIKYATKKRYSKIDKYIDDKTDRELADILYAYFNKQISLRAIGRVLNLSPNGTYMLINHIAQRLFLKGILFIELERSIK